MNYSDDLITKEETAREKADRAFTMVARDFFKFCKRVDLADREAFGYITYKLELCKKDLEKKICMIEEFGEC